MTATRINVRIEPIVRDGSSQTAAAWIEGVATKPYRLWFRLDCEHAISEPAQGHAFAVAVINQAMATGRDLHIDGPLTRGLIMNLDLYQRVWSTWEPRRFRHVALHASALVDDRPFQPERGALLPFSGGIDSLFSASVLRSEGTLAALLMIRGLDLTLRNERGWKRAFGATTILARSLGVPAIAAATNWQEITARLPGYLGYLAPTVAVPILISQQFGYSAIPSGYRYDHLAIPDETTPLTDPLLGRPDFPLLHHGAWMRRIDKARAIARWPEALQHMRPCAANPDSSDGTPCGQCRKCTYTALLFCGLGLPVPEALGGREPTAHAIESLEMTPYGILSLTEAVEAAKARRATDAWISVAERRIDQFDGNPAVVEKISDLERRLAYVMGGGPKRPLGRYIRRLTRALRGRNAPRDLEPLSRWPYVEKVQTPTPHSAANVEIETSQG
jgi:hypothetical protein